MSMWPLVVAASLTQPVFSVHALGVMGGDDDSNLSAFALGTPEAPEALLVDAGAFTRGLYTWKLGAGANTASPTQKVATLRAFFASLSGVLLTHAHLDHLSGLLLDSPVLMGAGRKTSLPMVLLPETFAVLREHVFSSALWVDLTKIPPKVPALEMRVTPPGKAVTLGDYTVEPVLLSHAIPSAAFLIGHANAFYLHLGDTGPTDAVWARVQPLLQSHQLRGIAIEVSFASTEEALALSTGHLTPKLLIAELTKLTGAHDLPGIAKALGPCRVMAIHIKAAASDAVLAELKALKAAGLPLVMPQAGGEYQF